MKALIGGIINNLEFVVFVASFVKQSATKAKEEELNSEQKLRMEISSPPNRLPTPSASSDLDEKFKARQLYCKKNDWKDRKHCDSFVESRDKQKASLYVILVLVGGN